MKSIHEYIDVLMEKISNELMQLLLLWLLLGGR